MHLYALAAADAVTPTISTFLADVGTFFTKAIAWLGEALAVVVGNPALLVLVLAMPICGFAVALLHRLVRM